MSEPRTPSPRPSAPDGPDTPPEPRAPLLAPDAPARLTVLLSSVPEDAQDVTFALCPSSSAGTCTGPAVPFELDDDAEPTLPTELTQELGAGVYTVTQAVSPGSTTSSITCGAGATVDLVERRATVDLAAGAQVTCRFNVSITTLTIKQATLTDRFQDFSFTGCAGVGGANGCSTFGLDDDPTNGLLPSSRTFRHLEAGTLYSVTQDEVDGFGVVTLSCTAGTVHVDAAARRVEIELAAGQQATCTFVDEATTLTIRQDTTPNGPQDYTFRGCKPSLGPGACAPFVLDDDTTSGTPSSATFTRLDADVDHTITQDMVIGAVLTSITCTDGVVDLAARRVTIRLDPGDVATCTFTDRTTMLTVVQDTTPNGPQDFAFTGCKSAGGPSACADLVLDDDTTSTDVPASVTFSGLEAGTEYTLTQKAATGFGLTALTCPGAEIDLASGKVRLELAAGDQVICTFANRPTTLTIVHDTTTNRTRDFVYTGCRTDDPGHCSTFALDDDEASALPRSVTSIGLDPATYTIRQFEEDGFGYGPTGGITCVGGAFDPDLPAHLVSVTLEPGDQVTCTFLSTATSLRVIVDNTPDDQQDFAFTMCGPEPGQCTPFVLDDYAGIAVPPSGWGVSELPAGEYTIRQENVAGWGLTKLSCFDGEVDRENATATVHLEPGDGVHCVFENTRTQLTIVQDSSPRSNSPIFTVDVCPTTGECAPVQLDDTPVTTTPTASAIVAIAQPGQYRLTQRVVEGWGLVGLSCTSGETPDLDARTIEIDLTLGEQVVCTFVDHRT